jgi:hypothetical protein
MKKLKLEGAILAVALVSAMSVNAQVYANFDDLTLTQTAYGYVLWDVMPVTYAGLTWESTGSVSDEYNNNWEVVQLNGGFQSYYSTTLTAQSGNQAAYNGGANGWASPVWVEDTASPFLFNGAYFASWPNSSPAGAPEVTVTGYLGGVQQWAITENINSSGWTLFNGTGTSPVDTLVIGDDADPSAPWLMDTLSYTPVPEPASFGLMILGGLVGLRRLLWRKQS